MKIFQIGFNKCGTTTIHRYLKRNGISSIHWDHGYLAQRMFENLRHGDKLLTGYESFQAFTDMEFLDESGRCYLEGYKLYPYLAEHYPEAVFILNTRSKEDWIRSRLAHERGKYVELFRAYYGVKSKEDVVEMWRDEWDNHHRQAIDFFSDRPTRFVVCRIETDLPHLLNRFLPECALSDNSYKICNVTKVKPRQASSVLNRIESIRRRGLLMLRGLGSGLRYGGA